MALERFSQNQGVSGGINVNNLFLRCLLSTEH
jgi:hypothetical protein